MTEEKKDLNILNIKILKLIDEYLLKHGTTVEIKILTEMDYLVWHDRIFCHVDTGISYQEDNGRVSYNISHQNIGEHLEEV